MKTIGLISNKKSKKLFLLPTAITNLTNSGIKVYVMRGYGNGLNISDDQYSQAGATVLDGYRDVISASDIICKTDAFDKKEINFMTGKIAVTMVNYLTHVDMLFYMLKNNVTGVAWNNLANANGYVFFPEIEKIKGEFAVKTIAEGMTKGLSKPKEKVVYPHPAKLLILNATYASVAAAKYALGNGFDVMLLDQDKDYLRDLRNDSDILSITSKNKTRFNVGVADFENLTKAFPNYQCFINTSINPEDRTKPRITKEMANSMPAGSILYDAGSEYGYAFAWMKKLAKPGVVYTRFNKIFYVAPEDTCELIAKQHSEIVSTNSVKPLIDFANEGQSNKFIAKTVICNKGKVVDTKVKETLTLY